MRAQSHRFCQNYDFEYDKSSFSISSYNIALAAYELPENEQLAQIPLLSQYFYFSHLNHLNAVVTE